MNLPELATALHAEAGAYAEVLGWVSLDAPVPSCPGWSVHRLTDHLGRVHRNVCQMLADPTPESGRWARLPHAPEGRAVIGWFTDGVAALEADLADLTSANAVDATADPDVALVPTWAGLQAPSFWPRRMAHETAVHRWDAESAGRPTHAVTPIEGVLAVDGIDEYFDVFVTHRLDADAIAELGPLSMTLVATDAGRGWRVVADGTAVTWADDVTPADPPEPTISGPASALLLFLWGRLAVDELGTEGPTAVAERWPAHVHF